MLSALEVPFMRRAAVAVTSSILSLAAAGVLAGCPDRSISKVDPAQGRVEFKDIPVTVNRDVDVLFLIDDSPSMGDKQVNLAANFPKFIDVLSSIQGGLPNVHIAVVTSDLGTKGAGDLTPAPGIGSLGSGGCSGLGKNGEMQLFGAPVNGGKYISDVRNADGTRTKNYPDPKGDGSGLAPVFATMAKAGAGGCGFEQHLEAVKQALQRTNVVNTGFLRDSAYLAVIIIADEDDCSMAHTSMLNSVETGPLGPLQSFRCTRFGVLCDDNGQTTSAMNQVNLKGKCHPNDNSEYLTKVADYAKFLKGLKDDPTKVIVAGIMGTTDRVETELRAPPKSSVKIPALAHSCTYIGGDSKAEVADPPVRLKFFLDQFPNRSTFASICQQDLSSGLQQIGDLLKTVIGDPCIEGKLADVDLKTPGNQFDCSVSSVTNPNKPTQEEKIMPKCTPEDASATNQPCWHLVSDPVNCKTDPVTGQRPDQLSLKIEGQMMLPTDTHMVANCVTEVTDATTP
jgi:hypothetical protein